jgi:hypothetical protein
VQLLWTPASEAIRYWFVTGAEVENELGPFPTETNRTLYARHVHC